MKSAEEIIKERIPNGIVNVKAEGGGNGKPQYAAEIEVIKKCMEEYASQFKATVPHWVQCSDRLPSKQGFYYTNLGPTNFIYNNLTNEWFWRNGKKGKVFQWLDETQSVTNEGASTATLEELEERVKDFLRDCANEKNPLRPERIAESIVNVILKPHLSALLKDSREEAIGFAVWMRDNEALVIAENEKTIGWEEMTYDWFYSLYLQSKTEQTNPIKQNRHGTQGAKRIL